VLYTIIFCIRGFCTKKPQQLICIYINNQSPLIPHPLLNSYSIYQCHLSTEWNIQLIKGSINIYKSSMSQALLACTIKWLAQYLLPWLLFCWTYWESPETSSQRFMESLGITLKPMKDCFAHKVTVCLQWPVKPCTRMTLMRINMHQAWQKNSWILI